MITHQQNSFANIRKFLEVAPDAMIIVDKSGQIILVNSLAEQLFRYPPAELLEEMVEALIPQRFRGPHPTHRDHFFRDPKVRAMGSGLELYGLRKDGTEFPVEISLSPLEVEGELLVASAIRDITERKKADELKFRLAAIVDSSDDAIISKSLDGLVLSWNKGAETLFGYSAEEMIGRPIHILMPGSRREEELELLERLKSGEKIETYEAVRLRKDGRSIDVSVTISPIHDSSGAIIAASKVARDITERKRAENAIARAKDAAERANRELETFSYSVAHDLRAPLRSIDGFSQSLLEDCAENLTPDGKRYLSKIRESAQYMARLIEDLLMLAGLSQNKLHHEAVNLSGLVEDAAARLRGQAPTREVEFSIGKGIVDHGDRRLLEIMFNNLLENAWKFTSRKPTARIEFGCLSQKGKPVYYIRDNGAGFDMAFSSKLFGVFQRLHTVREFEGTGIGLATVQRIAQRHAGRVWAEGEVGKGATFYFTLNEEQKNE